MSQHDFSIANQTASSARSDINSALQALASNNSGDAAPSTTYANQLWYQTNNNRLQMRNEANTAWLDLGYIDQSDGLEILDNTKLVDTSGTQVGLLGDQSTATWEAGTGNIDSLASPANIKAAILALAPQSSQSLSLGAVGTYAMMQNQSAGFAVGAGGSISGSSLRFHSINWSVTGSPTASGTWRVMGSFGASGTGSTSAITVCVRIS